MKNWILREKLIYGFDGGQLNSSFYLALMKVNRIISNILCTDLQVSKDFYCSLFSVKVNFESDWFVHLICNETLLEIGLIAQNSDVVPEGFSASPQGAYQTYVVEDVDEVFYKALTDKIEIIEEPITLFYGHRRMLLKDPDGALVDVSSPIPDFEF